MTDHYVLSENGEPVREPDLMTWARWFESADRSVAKDTINDAVSVSTVFLGLDHSFGSGPPMLFETMIFGGEHDGYQERAATREDALRQHAKALKLVQP